MSKTVISNDRYKYETLKPLLKYYSHYTYIMSFP